jgi:glycosyltransferase involved in cell wall biosynthesis
MRVALVQDWLTGMRGGEKVLEVLCELYPDADIFTLVHVRGTVSARIERHRIQSSVVQRLPLVARYYRSYLPVFPTAIELLDLDRYDLVVSSSHCAAKAVIAPAARHICYCHTPMRYAWEQFDAYFGPGRIGRTRSAVMRLVMRHMARWDRATAPRVQRYVANSRHVASRIRRYYNRRAAVVYPPVDTAFFHPDGRPPEDYFLIVSALVPYKRIDMAIEAAAQAGVVLKVVGDGPEQARLARWSGPHVEWLGTRTNEEIRELYRGAAAVVLPGEEDFGIVPVEAQACGRPVVALAKGGALETVVPGRTGILVDELSAEALVEGYRAALGQSWDAAAIREHAEPFNRERFANEMRNVIDETLAAPGDARW